MRRRRRDEDEAGPDRRRGAAEELRLSCLGGALLAPLLEGRGDQPGPFARGGSHRKAARCASSGERARAGQLATGTRADLPFGDQQVSCRKERCADRTGEGSRWQKRRAPALSPTMDRTLSLRLASPQLREQLKERGGAARYLKEPLPHVGPRAASPPLLRVKRPCMGKPASSFCK